MHGKESAGWEHPDSDKVMKVLIADDDPTLRLLMRQLLRSKLGHEVIETANGLEAWKALDEGSRPDLCILDMWMPQLGGLELLVKLRADPRFKTQKVMLCSMENGRKIIQQTVSLGIQGYLLKPFTAQQFVDHVRSSFDGGQPNAADRPLGPLDEALARLGAGKEAYLDLLAVFTADVENLVKELRGIPNDAAKPAMKLRLGALRGAGCTLGADALVGALTRLETAVAGASANRSLVESLHFENNEHFREQVKVSLNSIFTYSKLVSKFLVRNFISYLESYQPQEVK